MASTVAARRLTEAHRLAQLRLGAQTIARLRVLWHLLEPGSLDASFERWLKAVVPVVGAQRASSARLGANYMTTFKALEMGVGAPPPPPVLAERPNIKALTTSLLVTGPLSVKRAMARKVPLDTAVDIAEAASSASAMRYALDGGRETVAEMVKADRQARGYARVASANACAYCSGLAGITFADDTVFAAHDGCSCSSEPVYR